MKYEPLAIEITQNGGHHYRQVWRDENCAVYEQRGHYDQLLGYEAIVIKHQKAKELFGRHYPAKELYPVSEDWGRLAVTKENFGKAKAAALKLAKRQSEKSR
jgi:hypothetical protein